MNAYFELFGTGQCVKEDDAKGLAIIESLETADVKEITKKTKRKFGKNSVDVVGRRFFEIWPRIDSAPVREWIDNVLWAAISCNGTQICLKSDREREDEDAFLNGLKGIEYDNGYGFQELYGVIVFKDGSWLTRGEYDGSEWWRSHHYPVEPDWDNCNIWEVF